MAETITRRDFLSGKPMGKRTTSVKVDPHWPIPRVAKLYQKLLKQDPPFDHPKFEHVPSPELDVPTRLGRLRTPDWDSINSTHLLKRTLFSPTFTELENAEAGTMAQTINNLLAGQTAPDPPDSWVTEPPPVWDSLTQEEIMEILISYRLRMRTLVKWWGMEMRKDTFSIRENMTLFWHNHFATSAQKVIFPQAMYEQNKILREHCLGDFRELLRRITFGPAMLIWLDSYRSTKNEPNENFGRELLELFTMGVDTYTQTDIIEASRAFTGYLTDGVSTNYSYTLRSGIGNYWNNRHDFESKTFLGQTGTWNGDDIIDIILEQDVVANFICSKIYQWFVYENVDETFVDSMATVFRDSDYNIETTMEYLLTSDHFYDVNFHGAMVRNPMTVLFGTMRQLEMDDVSAEGNYFIRIAEYLGMIPMFPPDVNGWTGYRSWLNSITLPSRKMITTTYLDGYGGLGMIDTTADAVALAQTMTDPNDAEKIVEDFARLFSPFPLSDTLKTQLLDILLDGAAIYDWTISDASAEGRLKNLMRHMMRMPEFQLI